MVSIITIIILGVLLVLSVYKNIKLGIILLNLEDSIEECLDVVDEKYATMSEILERPLFFDSPEVRSVVKDIRQVRSSLHAVALVLTKNIVEENEKEES